jgi:uncharacterized membrane protein YphA (DoxX/SURF4 family)
MKKTIETNWKVLFLSILRMAIGWHFLYEGIAKLTLQNWSSYSYLSNSSGPLSGFYHWLASSKDILNIVDILNEYGLILIGVALFIGLFTKIAAIAGTLLLALYYFAYPPFGNSLFNITDSHLFIVDKIFIEAMVLMVFVFSREKGYGFDVMIGLLKKSVPKTQPENQENIQYSDSRRRAIKNLATLPVLGIMGAWAAGSNKRYSIDVMSGATIQLDRAAIGELKGTLPAGKLGRHSISRLVLGGNLIGGWAHSRDLIYVPSLFKAYNTEKKIYETLILAEKAGINSINIGFPTNALMAKYKKMTGSKIKVISQVAPNMTKGDYFEQINQAIDYGADILQVQGNWCDWLVRDQKPDVILKMLEKIRSHGITAGLGAHSVESLIFCEQQGIIPDYYMKTMHHDQYWSAHPREYRFPFEVDGKEYLDHNRFHNNMFCLFPERTVEFVNRVKIPVMGYKILAAGAIKPQDGFNWAFENGADFICVGMFDFQIVNDVNTCINTLNKLNNRRREWFG